MEKEKKQISPSVVTGALIINRKGNIFLARGKKWGNKFSVPGGHVNLDESLEDAMKREVKEELGVEVKIKSKISFGDNVLNRDYFKKKHFVFINFLCSYDGGDDEMELNDEFSGEYKWIEPEKSLKLDLAGGVRLMIEDFLKQENKKNKFRGWPVLIAVKAVIINNEENVLILKRTRKVQTYGGMYDLPGGEMEKGENALLALKREVIEETGLNDVQVGPIIKISEYPSGHEKIDELKALRFIAYCESKEVKLDKKEHDSFEWLNIDEAIKKLNTGNDFEEDKKDTLIEAKRYLEMQKGLDGWKRCQADFENYKKQQVESQEDIIKYSTENIVTHVLPVLDNFQVAMDHIPEKQEDDAWVQGITHIQKQLETVLADNGVEEIKIKAGDDFNPAFCEAVKGDSNTQMHSNDSNGIKIEKVILKGYKIGDKVIRPARVTVE